MNTDVDVTAKLAPMQRYILYQCAKYDRGLTIEEIYGFPKMRYPSMLIGTWRIWCLRDFFGRIMRSGSSRMRD